MTTDPKFPVELWPIERLIPSPKNAKIHSAEQIKTLAGLIKEYGWTQPLVADLDDEIIVGHGRRLAAMSLGLKKVPVVWRKDLTKAQADAMRLGDNKVSSTEYDMSLMKDELARLAGEGFDLGDFGFSERELAFMDGAILSEIDESAFVDDISQAVDDQRDENVARTAAVDASAAPVTDALGFKRVTVTESRELGSLMARIATKTGLTGAAALLTHLRATV